MLGLGFPGGPALDRLAQTGNARPFGFPKSRIKKDSLEFSFSGLKPHCCTRSIAWRNVNKSN